jgi:hypothetical protein
MARKRFEKSDKLAPKMKTAYRVVRNSCVHSGITYEIGDIMPELPLALLNVHLPNLELVEVEEVCVEDEACPMPEPETVVEVITQVESEGGTDYDVQL